MSGEEVDRAVRRIETRRPDLNMGVQSFGGGWTAGEGVDMIHQAALQPFRADSDFEAVRQGHCPDVPAPQFEYVLFGALPASPWVNRTNRRSG